MYKRWYDRWLAVIFIFCVVNGLSALCTWTHCTFPVTRVLDILSGSGLAVCSADFPLNHGGSCSVDQ